MPVEALSQSLSDLALRFGEDADDGETNMSRPFGVALIIAGWDDAGPALFYCDPSGLFVRYKAHAIGSGSEAAQAALKDSYRDDLTFPEAEKLALSTLKQVMEEKVTPSNIDIARVAPLYHLYSVAEVEEALSRL
eukprot:CAMPEP_0175062448 /NCGR_PEP_ID=MMETSP0052_2-20121109/14174_1 /TAXON_ID=51329 ORGANISM="Polytomella parva, Strain SAG 63-3" /NCGR_SAMPLE_ID=MMETSP0052_2 /ASSEMBLY_ACC=CAM_ASM_000194 /LENGTH=134 /DNA_ID=CAMNT_0016328471 /DNA_START=347 /DNA_END=751 /DNA_ORIENTATION=+